MSYLSAEQLIKDRLGAKMTLVPARNILSAADLEGVIEKNQVTPAIHVLYADDDIDTSIGGHSGTGQAQIVDQNWLVIVVVQNVRDKTGSGSRADAGAIIDEVLKALQGWPPAPDLGPLKRVRSRYRTTYRRGFGYFPFQFRTTKTVIGLGNE